MSEAILNKAAASRFNAPLTSTMASLALKASNLLGAVMNGLSVSLAMHWATRSAYSGCELRPKEILGH
jgi:uncharacterized membrane protein YjjB (DUF3815 family)